MADMPVGHGEFSSTINKDFLVKNGSCATCENKVQASSIIECDSCAAKFHAVCSSTTKQNKICNETLLKNFSQNSTKDNFKWYCNVCLTLYEHDKNSGIQNKLNTMLLKFEMLTNVIRDLQNEVECITDIQQCNHVEPVAAAPNPLVSDGNGYTHQKNAWNTHNFSRSSDQSRERQQPRDVNKSNHNNVMKRKKAKQPSLIVKCSEEGNCPDLTQIRDVAISNGIQVSSVNITSNNNAVVTLPNIDALNKFKLLLSTKPSLSKHAIDNVKRKLPRISILDIDEQFSETELVETIKIQNPDIAALLNNGETFSDIYIKNSENTQKYSQVNLNISEKIRNLISNRGNRLYIGLKSCRVVDRRYINRCFKCHDHSHLAAKCNNNTCCGYCASENHDSTDCEFKNDIENNKRSLNCINCKRNNLDHTGHSVYWPLCPVNKRFSKQPTSGSLNYGR